MQVQGRLKTLEAHQADTLFTLLKGGWYTLHSPSLPLVHFAQSQSAQLFSPYSCGAEPWEANQCLILKNPKTLYSSATFKE